MLESSTTPSFQTQFTNSNISEPNITVELLKSSNRLDKILQDGGEELNLISYSTSIDSLIDFFEMGYERINYICGQFLIKPFIEIIKDEGISKIKKLNDYIREGRLTVYVPKSTKFHTKLYIVKRQDVVKTGVGSANATRSGRKGRMYETMVFMDFHTQHGLLQQHESIFEKHKEKCTILFDDLNKILDEKPEEEHEKLIERFLENDLKYADEEAKEFHEITRNVFEDKEQIDETKILSISLDKVKRTSDTLMKGLRKFGPIKEGNNILISKKKFLEIKNHKLPVMYFDKEKLQIKMGLNDEHILTSNELKSEDISKSLKLVESYFDTVNLATCGDSGPEAVKMNMAEAMFSVFTGPFAHELMRIKREEVGLSVERGLRFSIIYGNSHNGKTFFSKLMLFWITGNIIRPQPGGDFTTTNVQGLNDWGTIFPMIFDDVPTRRLRESEKTFKEYYERWWTEDVPAPYMVITTNEYKLEPWAASRSKKYEFDVYFEGSIENQKLTHKLLKQKNNIFKYFSKLFIEELQKNQNYESDDENLIARNVWKKLYNLAGRNMPSYFPMQPLDKLYDPGVVKFKNMIYRDKIAKTSHKDGVLKIVFPDCETYEVKSFEKLLNQNCAPLSRGKSITIRNPMAFWKWLIPGYENMNRVKKAWRRKYG